jgi:hypothetical protein
MECRQDDGTFLSLIIASGFRFNILKVVIRETRCTVGTSASVFHCDVRVSKCKEKECLVLYSAMSVMG